MMTPLTPREPIIAVLCGGISAEREVSLGSGAASALALARSLPTRLFVVEADALPAGLDPARYVVFSTLHGTFGEDGGMQRLLDAAGIAYAGCDAAASALTMDKVATKAAAAAHGVNVARQLVFTAANKPTVDAVVSALGEQVVVKPSDEGSSVGLTVATDRAVLATALAAITKGNWMIEPRLVGRELSVGVLHGKAMGVIEIRPKSGVYDYASKYTAGATEYLAPAPLSESGWISSSVSKM
jgi:D-alanine-D-alanine ligase